MWQPQSVPTRAPRSFPASFQHRGAQEGATASKCQSSQQGKSAVLRSVKSWFGLGGGWCFSGSLVLKVALALEIQVLENGGKEQETRS